MAQLFKFIIVLGLFSLFLYGLIMAISYTFAAPGLALFFVVYLLFFRSK